MSMKITVVDVDDKKLGLCFMVSTV